MAIARRGRSDRLKGEPCQVSEWWNDTSPLLTGPGLWCHSFDFRIGGREKPFNVHKFFALFKVLLGTEKIHLIAPFVAAGHHPHTTVFLIGVIQGDPRGYRGHRKDYGPQRGILVPPCRPTVVSGFVLDLVVPDHQIGGIRQPAYPLNDGWVVDQPPKGWGRFPDIDNLPNSERSAVVSPLGHVAERDRLRLFAGKAGRDLSPRCGLNPLSVPPTRDQ